jgi:hypothetical protein
MPKIIYSFNSIMIIINKIFSFIILISVGILHIPFPAYIFIFRKFIYLFSSFESTFFLLLHWVAQNRSYAASIGCKCMHNVGQ